MKPVDFIAFLRRQGACGESLAWLESEGITDLETAWLRCPRGDWMDWLLDTMTQEQFAREISAIWAQYHAAMTEPERVYAEMTAEPRRIYDEAIAGALAVMDRQSLKAEEVHRAAMAGPRAAYENGGDFETFRLASNEARNAHMATMIEPRRVFNEIRARPRAVLDAAIDRAQEVYEPARAKIRSAQANEIRRLIPLDKLLAVL